MVAGLGGRPITKKALHALFETRAGGSSSSALDVPRPRPRRRRARAQTDGREGRDTGPHAESILKDVGCRRRPLALRSAMARPAGQVLPSRQLRGRQPAARPDERSVQARMERSNSLTSGHRACQGCGEALGARYALDAALRATDGKLIAANATGCLEVFSTPFPESLVAAAVDPLAVRQRAGGRHRDRRGAAGQGPRRRACGRPGRRRRHRGHRLRLPVGDVRAKRRRAVRLLRQRGLHEHRRAALGRHPARGTHRDNPSRSATSPATPSARARTLPLIAMAHEIPYVATATVADLRDLESKVERAMEIRGARYLHVLRDLPARLGLGRNATRSRSPAWPRRPACSPCSRPSTAR